MVMYDEEMYVMWWWLCWRRVLWIVGLRSVLGMQQGNLRKRGEEFGLACCWLVGCERFVEGCRMVEMGFRGWSVRYIAQTARLLLSFDLSLGERLLGSWKTLRRYLRCNRLANTTLHFLLRLVTKSSPSRSLLFVPSSQIL